MLEGRTIYALGDSIVAGHLYPRASFVDFVSRQERAVLVKAAVNGATVRPSANAIADQIRALPPAGPDFILFDGGTNDAYPDVLSVLGLVTENLEGPLDLATFAGSFESLVKGLKSRYPDADLVYVAVHKLAARDREIQETLRSLELTIAKKWGVAVADVYASDLDTSDETMRVAYSFDSLQPSGLPGTADTTGSWGSGDSLRPTGTHPNFPAIEEYYAPIVSETLRRVQESLSARAALAKAADGAAAGLNAGHYTPGSWAALMDAVKSASFVAAASNATAEETRASNQLVAAARHDLVVLDP